jgi:hypothetical protein
MIHLYLNQNEKTVSSIWGETELNYFADQWCIEPLTLYNAIIETGSNDVRYLYQYLRTRGEIAITRKFFKQLKNFVAFQ